MKVTRTSILTGETRTADLDVTTQQLNEWSLGGLVQAVMPHLPESHREFIINGTTPDEAIRHLGDSPDEIDTTPIPFVEVAA